MPQSKKSNIISITRNRTDWLDEEAKGLLRQGAMRLLREVACVDDMGQELPMDPRKSREAISALSLLFDKVPDVLQFEKRSTGQEHLSEGELSLTAIDLLTPAGRSAVTDALASLPSDLLRLVPDE